MFKVYKKEWRESWIEAMKFRAKRLREQGLTPKRYVPRIKRTKEIPLQSNDFKRCITMEEASWKKFNIRICPQCNDRYVPTFISPDKCLFCKRNNHTQRNDWYVIKKQSTLGTQ